MKILVTGGAGYVGSMLISKLIKKHNVTCLDRFFFGDEYLKKIKSNRLKLIKDDIRWFDPTILKNIDIVLDLAALSNDPSAELNPTNTYDINFLGRSRVAKYSKQFGVKKYILASTASVYGFRNTIANERSKVNPLTTYAKANWQAENEVLPLNDDSFSVTVLRFGTVYGVSPRMRFDLAVNIMTYNLFISGKITIDGDGSQSRPFVHINDVVRSYESVINANSKTVGGEIFNVGSKSQNYTISNLAKEIGRHSGINYEIIHKGTNDKRSYQASFDKIENELNFQTKFTVKNAVNDIINKLQSNELALTKKTITLEWYKHLIEMKILIDKISVRDKIL